MRPDIVRCLFMSAASAESDRLPDSYMYDGGDGGPGGGEGGSCSCCGVLVVANYGCWAEFGVMETGKLVTHDQHREQQSQQPHSQECRCTPR